MNIVDIVAFIILAFGAFSGFKKGALKSVVQLVGMVAVVILAYTFKDVLANFFIRKLPFFNFGGKLDGIYSINLMVYEGISFVVIFVLLYCILNIIVSLTGILDLLVKLTVVFELPSKIIGAFLGVVEALVFVFILGFSLLQFGQSQKFIMDSKVTRAIVEKTPIVKNVFAPAIIAAERTYLSIDNYQKTKDVDKANKEIGSSMVTSGLVSDEIFNECVENGKLHISNYTIYTFPQGGK